MALAGYFSYLGGVPQVWPLKGCGLWATSPLLSGLGQPSAGWAGLMAGLQVGQAFGMFLLPGFGVGSSSPWVPGHPTSMYDSGVNNN